MIYAYTLTPNFKRPVDGNPQTVELRDIAATVPSTEFLLTCRHVEQEAAVIFRAAQHSFWNGNTDFSVDLNDDWEDNDARKERHFEVLDLLDEASLFPELSDEQVNAMEKLTITVKSEISTFDLHLTNRIYQSTKHWALDLSSSTFPEFSGKNDFELSLAEIFLPGPYYRGWPYLQSAENTVLAAAHLANVPSGRRYKRCARSELQVKVAARRAELAANPPSARSSRVKKRQLDLLLQHCWIAYRARGAL